MSLFGQNWGRLVYSLYALAYSAAYKGGFTCNGVPTAYTKQGIVQGYIENGTGNYVYKGISYAQTTAGENRCVGAFDPEAIGN